MLCPWYLEFFIYKYSKPYIYIYIYIYREREREILRSLMQNNFHIEKREGYSFKHNNVHKDSPISWWGCRIQLCLRKGVRPPPPQFFCMWLLTASDSEASFLELWGMWGTHSLQLLPVPLWPKVIELVRVPSVGQIELFNNLLYWKSFRLDRIITVE